jgi:hypothetical protein
MEKRQATIVLYDALLQDGQKSWARSFLGLNSYVNNSVDRESGLPLAYHSLSHI